MAWIQLTLLSFAASGLQGLPIIRLDLCNILETRRQTTFLMCYNYEYQPITKFPDSVTYTRIAEH